jgi:sugar O-acyltransferase (sialic acid O-acetyltransferase NeuD family)
MIKERIILIGCGQHARMTIDNVDQMKNIEIFGLIAADKADTGKKIMGYEVVCSDKDVDVLLQENPDISGYFLGVGDLRIRQGLAAKFDSKLRAVNIIHPAAIVSRYAQIGTGNLLEAYTKIANGVILGSHCIVNSFTSINHDQIIGSNVLLAGNVSMAGKSIGDNTLIADGASIGFKKSVGRCCIIGDGAVVTKDIPDNSIVYGNPARKVRDNVW